MGFVKMLYLALSADSMPESAGISMPEFEQTGPPHTSEAGFEDEMCKCKLPSSSSQTRLDVSNILPHLQCEMLCGCVAH